VHPWHDVELRRDQALRVLRDAARLYEQEKPRLQDGDGGKPQAPGHGATRPPRKKATRKR